MADDTKITRLPNRKKPVPDTLQGPLRTVRGVPCRHNTIIVDPSLEEVTCGDCNEKLNAVWVLQRLAKEDDRLYWQRRELREEVERLKDRSRFKCGRCGTMNNIGQKLAFRTR